MSEDLQQLTVGGVLAVLIVREVFTFVRWMLTRHHHGPKNGTSGERPVEYWQQHMQLAAERAFEPVAVRVIDRLDALKQESKEGFSAVRASNHEVRDAINNLLGRLAGLR